MVDTQYWLKKIVNPYTSFYASTFSYLLRNLVPVLICHFFSNIRLSLIHEIDI